MTQPQIELKACPNPECNSDNVDLMSISMGECNWTVGCNECAMTGPQAFTTVQAATGWNQYLRSSPQVAPGLRDAAVDKNAIGDYLRRVVAQGIRNHTKDRDQANDQATRLLNWSDAGTDFLAMLSDNGMTIAAAQGGTVDRDVNWENLAIAYHDKMGEGHPLPRSFKSIPHRQRVEMTEAIKYTCELYAKWYALNPAVPSAPVSPANTERIADVFEAFANFRAKRANDHGKVDEALYQKLVDAILNLPKTVSSASGVERIKETVCSSCSHPRKSHDHGPSYCRERNCICGQYYGPEPDALGQPQGSDSLRLDWLDQASTNHEVAIFDGNLVVIKDGHITGEERGCWIELDGEQQAPAQNTLRAAIDAAMQPVGAGEARERGGDE